MSAPLTYSYSETFSDEGIYKFLFGTFFGVALNYIFESTFPSSEHPHVDGNPRWGLYSARVYQAVLMPLVLIGIFKDKGSSSIPAISVCSWGDAGSELCGSLFWEDVLMHVTVSYFIKDTLILLREPGNNVMFLVHHAVCIIGSGVLFFFPDQGGVTAFNIGMVNLEFGSSLMCAAMLRPDSKARFWIYIVGMTVSNIIASIILPTVLFMNSTCDIRHYIMVLTSIILSYMRQTFLIDYWTEQTKTTKTE